MNCSDICSKKLGGRTRIKTTWTITRWYCSGYMNFKHKTLIRQISSLHAHIAWSQGPHLGFSAQEHMGPMWKAHVGVINFAPEAPRDSTHGPHVGNHMGPTLDPTMKYTGTWESCGPH